LQRNVGLCSVDEVFPQELRIIEQLLCRRIANNMASRDQAAFSTTATWMLRCSYKM
jgi:hypothetical protein